MTKPIPNALRLASDAVDSPPAAQITDPYHEATSAPAAVDVQELVVHSLAQRKVLPARIQ